MRCFGAHQRLLSQPGDLETRRQVRLASFGPSTGQVTVGSTDISAQHGLLDLDRGRISPLAVRWSQMLLAASLSLLAVAPFFVPDTYSPIAHTISESGGQGVPGAWVERSGVILAAGAVLVMTMHTGPTWSRTASRWIRLFSAALLVLALFPESPWHGGSHDATVAMMHTVGGVVGAVSFTLGVVTVSLSSRRGWGARLYDGLMVSALISIPQVMLVSTVDGILQRLMVILGYGWLFLECRRMIVSGRRPGERS